MRWTRAIHRQRYVLQRIDWLTNVLSVRNFSLLKVKKKVICNSKIFCPLSNFFKNYFGIKILPPREGV